MKKLVKSLLKAIAVVAAMLITAAGLTWALNQFGIAFILAFVIVFLIVGFAVMFYIFSD